MPSRLSSLLVRDGLVGVRRMEKAFQRQVIYGGSLDTILLELGMVPEERLCQYLALASGLPPASRAEIEQIDPAAVALLPLDAAQSFRAIPLVIEGEAVRMAVCSPIDLEALEDLADQVDRPLRPLLVPEYRWQLMLTRAYGVSTPQRFVTLAAQLDKDPVTAPVGKSRTIIVEDEPERDTIVRANAPAVAAPPAPEPPATTDRATRPELGQARRSTSVTPPPGPIGDRTPTLRDVQPPEVVEPLELPEPIEARPRTTTRSRPPAVADATSPSGRRRTTLIGLTPVPSLTELPMQGDLLDASGELAASGVPDPIGSDTFPEEPTPQPRRGRADSRRPTEIMYPAPALSSTGKFPRPDTADTEIADVEAIPTPTEPTSSLGASSPTRPIRATSEPGAAPRATTSPILVPTDTSPISPREARELLIQAEHRDDVFIALLRAARHVAHWAGLLTLHGGAAIGRVALAHPDLDVAQIASVLIPLDAPSPVRTAMTSKRLYVGPLSKGDSAVDLMFLRLGGVRPPAMAVLPLVLRDRVVAMLVAHRGERDITFADVADLLPLAALATESIGRLILRSKGETGRIPTMPDAGAPPHETAAARAPASTTRATAPPADIAMQHRAASERSGPRRPARSTDPEDSDPEPAAAPRAVSDPPRQRPSRPSEPAWMPAARARAASAPSRGAGQTLPPLGNQVRSTGSAPAALPIEELLDLVEQRDPTAFEAAMDEAIARSSEALPVIAARFPGTLDVDRYEIAGRPLRAAQYGGLLELITRLGSAATEMLIDKLDAPSRDTRFYACVCIAELRPRGAIMAVTEHLFDPDFGVRACSLEALLGYPLRELSTSLTRLRQALHSDDVIRVTAAATAVASLTDRDAIPDLIAAMQRGPAFVEPCRRALVDLVKQDFGDADRRWLRWWEDHGRRHRVEWLIDALAHRDGELRAAAITELRRLTGESLGYDPELAKREREAAHRRWLTWWNETGRLRFVDHDSERHRPTALLPPRRP
ncbi:MAG: hypothetical protein R3B48_18380 [Kofleriaceae bacterium]